MNKQMTVLILTLLASTHAFAQEVAPKTQWQPASQGPEIEPGKCYPGQIFYYQLVKKLGNQTYELHSFNVQPKYGQALYRTNRDIKRTGMIGGQIKIIGTQEMATDDGFSKTLYVFTDCAQ